MSDWQPISTAPKDGRRVQLSHERDLSSCRTDSICPVSGFWEDGEWQVSAFFLVPFGRSAAVLSGNPTHWMPLPTPPETQDER
jgi:hypothetical protein